MSEEKEPRHFCKDFYEASLKLHKRKIDKFRFADQSEYLKLFEKAENKKVVGESTTYYIYSEVAAREIFQFNPSSKIIIIIREPVSLLYSYHSQALLKSIEVVGCFKKALELEKWRRQGQNNPPNIYYPTYLLYSEKVNYARHIKRYMQYFPETHIKILIFEDLIQRIEEHYKNILEFLEVDLKYKPNFQTYNPNEVPRNVLLNKYILHSRFKNFLHNKIPTSLYFKMVPIGKKLLWRRVQRKSIDPILRIELMKKFKPYVEETSILLGKDLSKRWGYDNI